MKRYNPMMVIKDTKFKFPTDFLEQNRDDKLIWLNNWLVKVSKLKEGAKKQRLLSIYTDWLEFLNPETKKERQQEHDDLYYRKPFHPSNKNIVNSLGIAYSAPQKGDIYIKEKVYSEDFFNLRYNEENSLTQEELDKQQDMIDAIVDDLYNIVEKQIGNRVTIYRNIAIKDIEVFKLHACGYDFSKIAKAVLNLNKAKDSENLKIQKILHKIYQDLEPHLQLLKIRYTNIFKANSNEIE